MKMDELKHVLEKFIIDKILKGDNATQFYLEAIKVHLKLVLLIFCDDLV